MLGQSSFFRAARNPDPPPKTSVPQFAPDELLRFSMIVSLADFMHTKHLDIQVQDPILSS